MAEVWGTLGEINFTTSEAPRRFRYSEATEYAKHPRIEGKAVLQKTGEGLQRLDLSFRFGIGWCNPDEQLQRLQQARIASNPMPLVLGQGSFYGNYVIEGIDVTLEQTDATGQTELIEVGCKLIETIDLPEPDTLLTQASPFEVRA